MSEANQISYEHLRQRAMAALTERGIDYSRVISEEQFSRMIQDGQILASRTGTGLANMVTQIAVPGPEQLGPIAIEVLAVVAGIVVGEITAKVADETLDVARVTVPSLEREVRRSLGRSP